MATEPLPEHVTQFASETTQLFDGREVDTDELFRVVYEDLRRLASSLFRGEAPNRTLQPTALVHESFVRLIGQQAEWKNEAQFFAIAACSMRRVLRDAARARGTQKRGAGARQVTFFDPAADDAPLEIDIVALDDALERLGRVDEKLVQVVELKFFGGLSFEEMGRVVGVTKTVVVRRWAKARALLLTYIEGSDA